MSVTDSTEQSLRALREERQRLLQKTAEELADIETQILAKSAPLTFIVQIFEFLLSAKTPPSQIADNLDKLRAMRDKKPVPP
jgi:hypothetical protein